MASLLASDPNKMDATGNEIVSELSNIFGRQQEELGGEKAPPDNVVDSINEVLAKKVSKSLKLE